MLFRYLFLFITGGTAYALLEIAWRGGTHWTMFIAGGVCLILLYLITTRLSAPIWQKAILGGFVITAVELVTGSVVNLLLGWSVWDYSAHSLNLWGQIWAGASLGWIALSVPVMGLCRVMDSYLFR